MVGRWTIVLDIEVARGIERWPRQNRLDLVAILDLLAAEGPSGFGWDALSNVGVASWSNIEAPYRRVLGRAVHERFYRLGLEILPGNAVRVSDPAYGVSRYWR
jgi:hypothetical protein